MPLHLSEIDGYKELQEQMEAMREKLEQMQGRDGYRTALPADKLIQSEANKLFIGRGGKPVDRHTFLRMIQGWKKSGELVLNQNLFESGGMRFISIDFLKGKQAQAKSQKMKRA